MKLFLLEVQQEYQKFKVQLRIFFNGRELNKTIIPDVAVAYGDAFQAAIVNNNIEDDDGLEN